MAHPPTPRPPLAEYNRLLYELLKKLDAELKHEVCHWAAYYERRMRLGQKAIFHLEGTFMFLDVGRNNDEDVSLVLFCTTTFHDDVVCSQLGGLISS
ncbi:hypothetical protein GBA52_013016 [Prunus armeniaca]|nr:hypothetical protein GBA52_013016 [Prunus armeniaca]